MKPESIIVKGAREHNLKNIALEIPKRALVVFTGPSGSGKSSLAFDTLFAEGQRRYVESLSAYARQFLGQMDKPEYDEIVGLSPTISIEQKTGSSNKRSTVGTITEVYDYLRVLFARIGKQYCYKCGKRVGGVAPEHIVRELAALPERTKFALYAPLVRNRKGEFKDLFDSLRREGFTRVRIDGEIQDLADVEKLKKTFRHDIDVVVDRLAVRPGFETRLSDSVETALRVGEGYLTAAFASGERDGEEAEYSVHRQCCGVAYPELTPQSFSFNSPVGMCPACNGLGTTLAMDPRKVVADESLSIVEEAIAPWKYRMSKAARWNWRVLEALCDKHDIDRKAPWGTLSDDAKDLILNGATAVETLHVKGRKKPTSIQFEGVLPQLLRRFRETEGENTREWYGSFLMESACEVCGGGRLRRESQAVPHHRPLDRRCQSRQRARCRDLLRRARPRRQRFRDWDRAAEGGSQPPTLPTRRRPRIPVSEPPGPYALRGRSTANPPRESAGLEAQRRPLCARRAIHRTSSARQQAPAVHAHASA